MIFVYILIGIGILYLWICFIMFYIICHKGEIRRITEGVEEASKPYKDIIDKALKYYDTLPKEDVYITSFDKLKLHGTLIRTFKARGTIVLIHGYKSNIIRDLVPALKMYISLQLNVILVDNRTVFESEGKWTTFGVLESKDAVKWVEYANKNLKVPVILAGISMGASACLYATPYLKNKAKFVVVDSPFAIPYEQIHYTINTFTPLKGGFFMPVINLYGKIFAKFNMKQSVLDALSKSHVPILFIHGKKDTFVPALNTLALYYNYKEDKKLFLTEEADHGLSYYLDNEGYVKNFRNFVIKYLKK